jgi:hypothetical protein
MPKPGEFTRSRRAAMQGVMWLVLLGAVGLASLVDRSINPAARNPALGPVRSDRGLNYRLPVGWMVTVWPVHVPGAAAIAEEPGQSATQFAQRRIIVYRQRIRPMLSPGEYLENSGLLNDVFGGADVEAQDSTLDGNRAVEISATLQISSDAGTAVESDILICSVFPNHLAVTLQLKKPGELNAGDRALWDQVVKSVRVDPGVASVGLRAQD